MNQIQEFEQVYLSRFEGEHPDFPLTSVTDLGNGLWIGGTTEGTRFFDNVILESFDHIYNLYIPEDKTNITNFCFEDSDMSHVDLDQLLKVINSIENRLINKEKVLVRCQVGLNRSALVCSLVLIKMGLSPKNSIDLIRNKRSKLVLYNKTYERWIIKSGHSFVN
jgi:protein-tyrosine phosphatase